VWERCDRERDRDRDWDLDLDCDRDRDCDLDRDRDRPRLRGLKTSLLLSLLTLLLPLSPLCSWSSLLLPLA
jgi:hypothetical protein